MSKTELRQKLNEEIDVADWSMIAPHIERNAVFVIENKIELIDAGVALATDDVAQVASWQQSQILRRPTTEEIELWKKDPYQKLFQSLIVQPFVLIQTLSAANEV